MSFCLMLFYELCKKKNVSVMGLSLKFTTNHSYIVRLQHMNKFHDLLKNNNKTLLTSAIGSLVNRDEKNVNIKISGVYNDLNVYCP